MIYEAIAPTRYIFHFKIKLYVNIKRLIEINGLKKSHFTSLLLSVIKARYIIIDKSSHKCPQQ